MTQAEAERASRGRSVRARASAERVRPHAKPARATRSQSKSKYRRTRARTRSCGSQGPLLEGKRRRGETAAAIARAKSKNRSLRRWSSRPAARPTQTRSLMLTRRGTRRCISGESVRAHIVLTQRALRDGWEGEEGAGDADLGERSLHASGSSCSSEEPEHAQERAAAHRVEYEGELGVEEGNDGGEEAGRDGEEDVAERGEAAKTSVSSCRRAKCGERQ